MSDNKPTPMTEISLREIPPIVERVARSIAIGDGVDPDEEHIGFGHYIEFGVTYRSWMARINAARQVVQDFNLDSTPPEPV